MRHATVAVVVAALVVVSSLAVGVATPVAAQQANYDVTLDLPEDFSTVGNHSVTVTVTNNDGVNNFPSPVIEIPIDADVKEAYEATDRAYATDGSGNRVAPSGGDRRADVGTSQYRTGDAIFIYGNEVPADGTRVYHVDLNATSAGVKTVETRVQPLNNPNLDVRDSVNQDVLGAGTINASVVDADGGTVTGDVLLNGSNEGDDVSTEVVEGFHGVGTTVADRPSFTFDVDVGETREATFVEDTSGDVELVAYTGSDASLNGDPGTAFERGNAANPGEAVVSYNFSADGRAVFNVSAPSDNPVKPDAVDVETFDANEVSREVHDGEVRITLRGTGASPGAVVSFEGYPTGDVTNDGDVTAADASQVAQTVLADGDVAYGDVNDDGRITLVDAMLIQQHADGNLGDDYGGVV